MPAVRATTVLLLLVGVAILGRSSSGSDEVPDTIPRTPIALVGGTVHPVSSKPIASGTVVIDRGKITAVGRKVKLPPKTKQIEVAGRHVYPGLFNAHTQLGLVEIKAVRATRDYRETGTINPNVKAEVAVNPDSELIPVTRAGGVLLALTAPSGGLISGTSAVLQLDGWTWEEMTLKAPAGMHVDWPSLSPAAKWPAGKAGELGEYALGKALGILEQTFADARAYREARAAAPKEHPRDARLEAMLPVLEGEVPLIVSADKLQEIQSAVAFAKRHRVKLIVHGGYDAPECAALLNRHGVGVITSVHRLPLRRDDPYDAAYTLPARLHAAGVPFCITATNTSNARNLPHHAATAVGFGLPRNEALKAITLYPAQILGVDDRVGSIEVGKDATLIVTDGDPLATPTQVTAAYLAGRPVDLSSRHTRLWKKYEQKYLRTKTPPRSR